MQQRREPDAERCPVDRLRRSPAWSERSPAARHRPKDRARLPARRRPKAAVRPRDPFTAPEIAAPGLIARSVASSRASVPSSASSILVTISRSAISTCRRPSGSPRSCVNACSASTATMISLTTMWCTRTGSARIASTIGPGSARPLVSSTMRCSRSSPEAVRLRSSQIALSNVSRSARAVQQAQPPASTAMREERVSRTSSTGVSAASLTTTKASSSAPSCNW